MEKITFYDLDNIVDLLESGDNVVTYYWTDSDGNEQGIDLDITVNEEGISSVKEKNLPIKS